MKKSITILGSTGSIGQTTVKLIKNNIANFEVDALISKENIELLAKQAIELNAKKAVVEDVNRYQELKDALSGTNIDVGAGSEAIIEAASYGSDIVMAAIVGAAGILPILAAINSGSNIALANKEALVCAGDIIINSAKKNNIKILPTDSEHSAIFQVFDFNQPESIDKIILTASGGPFLRYSENELKHVTVEQALLHPNWSMGKKITIDCATMINKGLEIIEAFYLFPIKLEQIDVLIHPQSIIHSLVKYKDGSFLAQIGNNNMEVPISFSIAYPNRLETESRNFDLSHLTLQFEKPDYKQFPALNMARNSIKAGAWSMIALNAANEIAVDSFLKHRIKFTDIINIIQETLDNIQPEIISTIEDVIEFDKIARNFSIEKIQSHF